MKTKETKQDNNIKDEATLEDNQQVLKKHNIEKKHTILVSLGYIFFNIIYSILSVIVFKENYNIIRNFCLTVAFAVCVISLLVKFWRKTHINIYIFGLQIITYIVSLIFTNNWHRDTRLISDFNRLIILFDNVDKGILIAGVCGIICFISLVAIWIMAIIRNRRDYSSFTKKQKNDGVMLSKNEAGQQENDPNLQCKDREPENSNDGDPQNNNNNVSQITDRNNSKNGIGGETLLPKLIPVIFVIFAVILLIVFSVRIISNSDWSVLTQIFENMNSANIDPIKYTTSLVGNVCNIVTGVLLLIISIVFIGYCFCIGIRILWSGIYSLYRDSNQDIFTLSERNIHAFSMLIVGVGIIMMLSNNDFTLDKLYSIAAESNYIALPLLLLGGSAFVFLLIKITNYTLSLIIRINNSSKPNSKDRDDIANKLSTFGGRIFIISCNIIEFTLSTIESAINFIRFIPSNLLDAFTSLLWQDDKKIPTPDTSQQGKNASSNEIKDEERQDSTNTVVQTPQSNNTDKTVYHNTKIIQLLTIAAFSFAIVSFIATSYGLCKYVYTDDQQYLAYFISFGIQAILFVFNLKLPYYWGVLRNIKRDKREKTDNKLRVLFVVFYILLLFSSSFMAFVHTVNAAYSENRYIDSDVLLESKYNKYLNQAQQYCDEVRKYYEIEISSTLANITREVASDAKLQNDTIDIEAFWNFMNLSMFAVEYNKIFTDEALTKEDKYEKWDSLISETTKLFRDYLNTATYQDLLALISDIELRISLVEGEVDKAENEAHQILLDMLSTLKTETTRTRSARSMKRIEQEVSDLEVVTSASDEILINVLSENFNSSEVAGYLEEIIRVVESRPEAFSDYMEVITNVKNISLYLENYEKITVSLPALDEHRCKITNGNTAEKTEIDKWDNFWSDNYYRLKHEISLLPNVKLQHGNETLYSVNVINDFSPDGVIQEMDTTLHKNLSTVNALERALYLTFHNENHQTVAVISWIIAFSLDTFSLIAGMFIYYINNSLKVEDSKD